MCRMLFLLLCFLTVPTLIHSGNDANLTAVLETIKDMVEGTMSGEMSEVEATHEWRALRNNDLPPKGAEVRMDAVTGQRFVKLRDEAREDGSVAQVGEGDELADLSKLAKASISSLDDHPVEDTDAARAERMLDALASLPPDERLRMGLDTEALRFVPLSERLPHLERLWAVRQEELKEAYDAMVKPNELLQARIDVLQDVDATMSDLMETLTLLEDDLSDIDMAKDFHTMGGFPLITSMLDTSRPEAVREAAAWAIGTAIRNDPYCQQWVLEEGPHGEPAALTLLLQNIAVTKTSSLRAKLVFALSSGTRFNPRVQLMFGSMQGEVALSAMYDEEDTSPQVRIRILVLVSDLVNEGARGSVAAQEAVAPVMASEGGEGGGKWCDRTHKALGWVDTPQALEKVLGAVRSLKDVCSREFSSLGTRRRLLSMREQYSDDHGLGDVDDMDNGYRREIERDLWEAAYSLQE
ncbi:unnamed protein product [Discosporangium mesarthrocarpum]